MYAHVTSLEIPFGVSLISVSASAAEPTTPRVVLSIGRYNEVSVTMTWRELRQLSDYLVSQLAGDEAAEVPDDVAVLAPWEPEYQTADERL